MDARTELIEFHHRILHRQKQQKFLQPDKWCGIGDVLPNSKSAPADTAV